MTPITHERWQQAQQAERKLHKLGFNEGIGHYFWTYRNYFKYLGISPDQKGKTIIEIGPADFPALMFCYAFEGLVIEPMESEYLKHICERLGIGRSFMPVEESSHLPECDEIWLFNVMQHVIDPAKFVDACKTATKCIRFFEPIDQYVCEHHPHTFSMQDFIAWYGFETVNIYDERLPGFFDDKCAYGTWYKNTL